MFRNLKNPKLNIDELNELFKTPKFINIQDKTFNYLYCKPINKFAKNRDIFDKDLKKLFVKYKIAGKFDELAAFLDARKEYTKAAVLLFSIQNDYLSKDA